MCAYLLSLQLVVLASDANTDEERIHAEAWTDLGDMHLGWRADPLPPDGDQRSQASDRFD